MGQFDLRRRNDRLGPALDPKLLQDRRDVGFHGRGGDAERSCDLLVGQPLREHHQDANLLWGQGGEPGYQMRHFGVGITLALNARRASMPGGIHTSPESTWAIAARILSRPSV